MICPWGPNIVAIDSLILNSWAIDWLDSSKVSPDLLLSVKLLVLLCSPIWGWGNVPSLPPMLCLWNSLGFFSDPGELMLFRFIIERAPLAFWFYWVLSLDLFLCCLFSSNCFSILFSSFWISNSSWGTSMNVKFSSPVMTFLFYYSCYCFYYCWLSDEDF